MEQIGPYKILKRLGGGGFGEVWLGESQLRQAAIKVFKPKDENLIAFATSSNTEGLEVLRTRFLAEARILDQLKNNPHIVSVYEFNELEDGSPYYVMEYLPRNLTELLGKDIFDAAAVGELPVAEKPRSISLNDALNYLNQILDGLAAAHQLGLVHRDIKPSNMMLGDSNQIQIVDFGIAKAPDGQHSTVSQLGMGSRNYMAPEQRESAKHVDARADVYSVGVMAYRMITGRLPVDRWSDPNVHVPDLSQQLNDLIVSCLSQDKNARPTDAGELKALFQAALADQGVADENATGTWVGGAGESTIRDELNPLKTRIERVLLAESEISSTEYAALQTMALVVDLEDEALDQLITLATNQLQAKIKPIQNLLRAIRIKTEDGEVSDVDRMIFYDMGERIGWSNDKVSKLLATEAIAGRGQAGDYLSEGDENSLSPLIADSTAPSIDRLTETKPTKVCDDEELAADATITQDGSPTTMDLDPVAAVNRIKRWVSLLTLVFVIGIGSFVYLDIQTKDPGETIVEHGRYTGGGSDKRLKLLVMGVVDSTTLPADHPAYDRAGEALRSVLMENGHDVTLTPSNFGLDCEKQDCSDVSYGDLIPAAMERKPSIENILFFKVRVQERKTAEGPRQLVSVYVDLVDPRNMRVRRSWQGPAREYVDVATGVSLQNWQAREAAQQAESVGQVMTLFLLDLERAYVFSLIDFHTAELNIFENIMATRGAMMTAGNSIGPKRQLLHFIETRQYEVETNYDVIELRKFLNEVLEESGASHYVLRSNGDSENRFAYARTQMPFLYVYLCFAIFLPCLSVIYIFMRMVRRRRRTVIQKTY